MVHSEGWQVETDNGNKHAADLTHMWGDDFPLFKAQLDAEREAAAKVHIS